VEHAEDIPIDQV